MRHEPVKRPRAHRFEEAEHCSNCVPSIYSGWFRPHASQSFHVAGLLSITHVVVSVHSPARIADCAGRDLVAATIVSDRKSNPPQEFLWILQSGPGQSGNTNAAILAIPRRRQSAMVPGASAGSIYAPARGSVLRRGPLPRHSSYPRWSGCKWRWQCSIHSP